MSRRDYERIERQNAINLNVFSYENGRIFPVYASRGEFSQDLDVLLLTRGSGKERVSHYVFVKDFDRLKFRQTKHRGRKHFCKRCLQCFTTESILSEHKPVCLSVNGTQTIVMPEEWESKLSFRNFHRQLDVPFVIYADFEALLIPEEREFGKGSKLFQRHECCGFAYKVVCCYDDEYSRPARVFRGENAVQRFLECMEEEVGYCEFVQVGSW